MNIKEHFFNRQCDVCGTLLDEECWHGDLDAMREVANQLYLMR